MAERSGQQHPIKLFSYTTRYFWLLIIPILRSLYSLSFSVDALRVWLAGTWFDLIVIATILAFAWLRLVSVTYSFNQERIIVRRGIFINAEDLIYYREISTLSIKRNIIYKIVGASKVYIGTNAGIFDRADITLVMKRSDADCLYGCVMNSRARTINYSVSPNRLRLFIFSIISSSTLSGAIVALAFVIEVSRLIDRELEARLIMDALNEFAARMSAIVPPITAGISAVIALSWLISFVTNLFYFWNYILTKSPDSIYVKSGLIAKNGHIIRLDRINFIDLRQNLSAKLFRISSLHCQCSGYGSTGRSELSVVLPITTSNEIKGAIQEVFPEYPNPEIQLKPSLRSFPGFYFWPVILAILPLAAYALICLIFPGWKTIAEAALLVAEVPAVWLAVVKTVAIFTTGIGFSDGHLVMKYAKRYGFHTVISPKDRITKIVIRQSVPQHIGGSCTVIIYTASDKKVRHIIYGLRLDKALSFFDKQGFDLYYSENPLQ